MNADRPDELISGGGVLVRDGKILAVGRTQDLRAQADRITDMPGHLLLPGLVNAHAHLELSLCRAAKPPQNFAHWLAAMIRDAGAGFG